MGSMSDEEYGAIMGAGFGGNADYTSMEAFINTNYELPNTEGVNKKMIDDISKYIAENLPQVGVTDE